jgi:hypothetical protein
MRSISQLFSHIHIVVFFRPLELSALYGQAGWQLK